MLAKKAKKRSKQALKLKKQRSTSEQHYATFEPGKVTVRFGDTHELVGHLLSLAKNLSAQHVEQGLPTTVAEKLGSARAITIVEASSGSTDLQATISDLGLSPLIFRRSVANGVRQAGFAIDEAKVPANPTTKLIEAVIAIQGAPKSSSS